MEFPDFCVTVVVFPEVVQRAHSTQVVDAMAMDREGEGCSGQILKNAVEHVVSDDSFNVPLEPAATALSQARAVLELSPRTKQQCKTLK